MTYTYIMYIYKMDYECKDIEIFAGSWLKLHMSHMSFSCREFRTELPVGASEPVHVYRTCTSRGGGAAGKKAAVVTVS